jgi:hypothetical protein
MNEPSLFLSSCSRRQWARRRAGRSRVVTSPLVIPGLVALSSVLAVVVVLLAVGHGTL